MKRILYYTLFVLCAAACGQRVSQEESASTEYETMTVSRSDISLEETYPASIEGRQSIRIIPRVEGYLQDIKVKEGQRVRKGQVLFVLDQANYVADEKAARANVGVVKAGVETPQLNYDSRKGLREKNIVSEYDLQTAAATLSLAKAQLQQAEAQWEAARSNLSYTVLKSPSDGVVGSLPYRKGDYVGPTIQDGVVRLHTLKGETHLLALTLDQAEKELDPQRFMRVNRQFIVNAAAVEKLSNWFLGKMRVHLKGYPDTEIIMSKKKATSVKRWLDS